MLIKRRLGLIFWTLSTKRKWFWRFKRHLNFLKRHLKTQFQKLLMNRLEAIGELLRVGGNQYEESQ